MAIVKQSITSVLCLGYLLVSSTSAYAQFKGDASQATVVATGASQSRSLAALSASDLIANQLASAAIPSSQINLASGVAPLDSNKLVPSANIPFGTTTGKVADGGTLATVSGVASAALPSSKVGAASGAASLDTNGLVPFIQVPIGMVTGTVADAGWVITWVSANALLLTNGVAQVALVPEPTLTGTRSTANTDCGTTLNYNGTAAITVSVTALNIGCRIEISQLSTGVITVQNAAGEMLGSYNSTLGTTNTPTTQAGSTSFAFSGQFDSHVIEQHTANLALISSGQGH